MTDTVLRVQLSELKTVRIMCKRNNCGASIEVSMDQMKGSLKGANCPACGESFAMCYGNENPFADLSKAVSMLLTMHKNFDVQFPIRSGLPPLP